MLGPFSSSSLSSSSLLSADLAREAGDFLALLKENRRINEGNSGGSSSSNNNNSPSNNNGDASKFCDSTALLSVAEDIIFGPATVKPPPSSFSANLQEDHQSPLLLQIVPAALQEQQQQVPCLQEAEVLFTLLQPATTSYEASPDLLNLLPAPCEQDDQGLALLVPLPATAAADQHHFQTNNILEGGGGGGGLLQISDANRFVLRLQTG